MIRLVFLFLLFYPSLPLRAAEIRVVSSSLCSDQLILALAPEKLIAVTPLSTDKRAALLPLQADDPRVMSPEAETILSLAPDLVVTAAFGPKKSLFERLGLTVYALPYARSFKDIAAITESLGQKLGKTEKARQLLERMQTHLGKTEKTGKRALMIQPGGLVTGKDTLGDDVLTAAGLENAAAHTGLRFLTLEEMVAQKADILLIEKTEETYSRSTSLLSHPLFDKSIVKRIKYDGRYLTCGLPQSAELVPLIRKALK